jgi:hypothetical protein
MKFRGIVLFAAGLLVGGLVVPVAAQGDPAENQIVIRSDGFIFLLRSGQRHLVSPVALTDEEINGYPEGEPFLAGLVPVEAVSAAPAGTFGGSTFGNSSTSSSGNRTSSTTASKPEASSGSSGSSGSASSSSSSSPIEARFKTIPSSAEQNEKYAVVIEAPDGSTCEGKIQFKGGKTAAFTSGKTSKSECKMELTIPDDARIGDADVKAVVKSGSQITEFEDVTEVFAAGKSTTSGGGDVKLEWKQIPNSIKQGERLEFVITTVRGADCEGTVELSGGNEIDLDSTTAKSNGECKMEGDIPSDAKTGKATVKMRVIDDDESSEDEHTITVNRK